MFAPITKRRSVQERRIELTTGGVLEFWSLENSDVARGRKYKRIIVDESAMVPDLIDIWQYALRPTLADYSGDGWFLSTPKGRNAFWQMWQWGKDPLIPEWRSWQMPSTVNPRVPLGAIDELRRTMPDRVFQQEIMAIFMEDGVGVFRRVRESATAEPLQSHLLGHTMIAGLDWALSYDYTALSIVDATTRRLVHVERFNGIDYSMQRDRIRATCERFKVAGVIAEENAMVKPNNDELRRGGLPVRDFTTTNASKSEIIESLASAFENSAIAIVPDETLIAELQSYESERMASGGVRYSAPPGGHDDMVMSLALAWHGAQTGQKRRATTKEY